MARLDHRRRDIHHADCAGFRILQDLFHCYWLVGIWLRLSSILIYSVNRHCGRSAFSGSLAAEWIDKDALVLLVMLRDFESITDLQAVESRSLPAIGAWRTHRILIGGRSIRHFVNSEFNSQEKLRHVSKLDSATTGRWIGNRSKLSSAGDYFDFLLLAAGHPGDHFCDASQRQSSRGRYRGRAGCVEEGEDVQLHRAGHRYSRNHFRDHLRGVYSRHCRAERSPLSRPPFRWREFLGRGLDLRGLRLVTLS